MLTFGELNTRSHFPSIKLSFIFFIVIIFFYTLGDSIMSFMAPNLIESIVDNELLTGIIFSFSSVVGLIMDYLLSNSIKEKSVLFYSFFGIVVAIFFPAVFIFKTNVLTALIAMGIWGIYYEMILFAKSHYIHHHLNHDQHDLGWAFFNAFGSLAYLIGPTFAISISILGDKIPLFVALSMQGITLIGLIIYRISFGNQIKQSTPPSVSQSTSFLAGIKLWGILNRRLYPVLLYLFLLNIIDATFWTMGAILANSHHSPIANLFFVIYLLPAFVISPLGIKLSRYFGKKRTSLSGGLIAVISYGLSLFVQDFSAFMIFIGIGSIFFAVTIPEIRGAIEDYCERLGHNSNTLVGLTSSMGSLGYIIGPILSGAIASQIGDQRAFGAIGWILAVVSLVLLVITPRKIRLPQQQLANQY